MTAPATNTRRPPLSNTFDPASSFAGIDIVISQDLPRYLLPDELIPGVPWPPGFRDEFNRWSRAFLGTTNLVPLGSAYVIANRRIAIRQEDFSRLRAALK